MKNCFFLAIFFLGGGGGGIEKKVPVGTDLLTRALHQKLFFFKAGLSVEMNYKEDRRGGGWPLKMDRFIEEI